MRDLQRSLPFGRPAAGDGGASPSPRVAGRRGGGDGRSSGAGGHARGRQRRSARAEADPAARERETLRRRQFERLMERLRADARVIADHFGLRYKALQIERPTARSHYGVCYQDGTIKIRLNHVVYQRPLRYSSLVNTVCHELAHLRHFDHGEGFKRFYGRILEWARARRIYRPAGPRPQQASLELAEPEECRVDAGEARRFVGMIRRRLEVAGATEGRKVRGERRAGSTERGGC
jgi:hypothetical protein